LDTVLGWAPLMVLGKAQRDLAQGRAAVEDIAALAARVADRSLRNEHTPVADQPLISAHLPWMVDSAIGRPARDQSWRDLSALEQVATVGPARSGSARPRHRAR